MKKRNFGIAAMLVVLMLVLAACASSPFTGSWLGWLGEPSKNAVQYVFFAGGDGVRREMRGVQGDGSFSPSPAFERAFSWTADDDLLEIHFESSAEPLVYYYEFLDHYNLSIRNIEWLEGSDWVLTRQHDY